MPRLPMFLCVLAATACATSFETEPALDAGIDGPADSLPASPPSCNSNDPDRVLALRCYTCRYACAQDLPAYCAGSGWPARSASCLREERGSTLSPVYRWYEAGSDDPLAHQEYLRPFMLLGYLRKLREAASVSPHHHKVLEDQLAYVLGHTKTYAADATGPRATVWQSYYRRPSDGAVRVYADGLNQAAYAFFFLSIAKLHGAADPARRDHYVRLAIQVDNAMERPFGNKTGGTRRVNSQACGAAGFTGPCWYFHSRAPENVWQPGTALNQSLHVTRIATDLLGELANPVWAQSWPADAELDRDAWRERLRERLANALNQWAYGAGNTATSPDAPPNLVQHARRKGTTAPYYWADYEFDLATHQGREVGSRAHMCNYHTVTIGELAGILRSIDVNPDGTGVPGAAYGQLGSGARRDRIFKAFAKLVTYTHSGGIIEATGTASFNPLYQWFVSDVTPAFRSGAEQCPTAEQGGPDPLPPLYVAYLCRRFGGGANPAIAASCAN
jgi:hypothetical protein